MPRQELIYEPDFPDKEAIQTAFRQTIFAKPGKTKSGASPVPVALLSSFRWHHPNRTESGKKESLGSNGSPRTPNRVADEGRALFGPGYRWRG